METPPSYGGPGRARGSNMWIWIIVGVLACCCLPLGLLGGLGWFGFNAAKGIAGCSLNFVAVNKGIRAYANAHGGMLPPAATWQTDVSPFVTKELEKVNQEGNPFKDSTMTGSGDWGCKEGDKMTTGVMYNSDVAGKMLSTINNLDTVLVYEAPKVGKNLAAPYAPLDPNLAPKLGGNPRGWIYCTVGGETKVHSKKGDSSINANVTVQTK